MRRCSQLNMNNTHVFETDTEQRGGHHVTRPLLAQMQSVQHNRRCACRGHLQCDNGTKGSKIGRCMPVTVLAVPPPVHIAGSVYRVNVDYEHR